MKDLQPKLGETLREEIKRLKAEAAAAPATINAKISDVLGNALGGGWDKDVYEKYHDSLGYVRWGLVEKDMHDAVNAVLQPNIPVERP